MSFFKKEVTDRIFGKKARWSISLINCVLNWHTSSMLELTARSKVKGFDGILYVSPKISPVKDTSFIRIFVYSKEDKDLHVTFDITTAKELTSDVITISEEKLPASQVSGIEKKDLNNDIYHENILVHPTDLDILFELHMSNNAEPSRETIISDFRSIANSLKV